MTLLGRHHPTETRFVVCTSPSIHLALSPTRRRLPLRSSLHQYPPRMLLPVHHVAPDALQHQAPGLPQSQCHLTRALPPFAFGIPCVRFAVAGSVTTPRKLHLAIRPTPHACITTVRGMVFACIDIHVRSRCSILMSRRFASASYSSSLQKVTRLHLVKPTRSVGACCTYRLRSSFLSSKRAEYFAAPCACRQVLSRAP